MPSEGIVLSRLEAFDVLGAIDDAQVLLVDTDYLVVLLQLEEATFLFIERLYPS